MRLIYSENEPIERAPKREVGDALVVINKTTGMPEVAYVYKDSELYFIEDNIPYKLSPYYWEIAWP